MLNFFQKKPNGEEVILKIAGMHCTSCAMNIDGALEDTAGVLSSNTSYAKSEVKINFDPSKVTKKELAQVIATEGYTVVD